MGAACAFAIIGNPASATPAPALPKKRRRDAEGAVFTADVASAALGLRAILLLLDLSLHGNRGGAFLFRLTVAEDPFQGWF
jgi:hypothetical protein